MSGYDERKRGMDTKLTHDSEVKFRVTNRRHRLLGDWAAKRLGKTGDEAEAYSREVVRADFEEPGEEDVIRKLLADFAEAGVEVTRAEVLAEMARLQPVAEQQVLAEA
ncbi:MAG: DUF1476 domain-containing protein [Planctomycetota bacterium]